MKDKSKHINSLGTTYQPTILGSSLLLIEAIVSGLVEAFITDEDLLLGWTLTLKARVHPSKASKSSGKHLGSSSQS